jgi:hypothetical protein
MTELHDAWEAVHAAMPPGWHVGRPGQRHDGSWTQYAFDTSERVQMGRRSREWVAQANSEVDCVREMARCLRKIGEGRVPQQAVSRSQR